MSNEKEPVEMGSVPPYQPHPGPGAAAGPAPAGAGGPYGQPAGNTPTMTPNSTGPAPPYQSPPPQQGYGFPPPGGPPPQQQQQQSPGGPPGGPPGGQNFAPHGGPPPQQQFQQPPPGQQQQQQQQGFQPQRPGGPPPQHHPGGIPMQQMPPQGQRPPQGMPQSPSQKPAGTLFGGQLGQQQQQQPPQQQRPMQQQPTNSVYQTAIPLQALTSSAAPVDCPMCKHRGMTRIQLHAGNTTHLWAIVACVCLCLGCIPYLISSLKDVDHYCSHCGVKLATWFNSGRTEVSAHG